MNKFVLLKDVTTGEVYNNIDSDIYKILIRTVCMMIYPGAKFRSKRERLEKSFHSNAASHKQINDSRKHEKRGHIVGSIFKIQCDHFFMGKTRSLNEILYAYECGYFSEWSHAGWNIGIAKRYMKDYRCVSHLHAADYMLTQSYIRANSGMDEGFFKHQFNSLFRDPALFLNTAEGYADLAAKAGIIGNRKQDMWMPSGWRKVAGNFPPIPLSVQEGYEAELALFDRLAMQYRETRAWEYDHPQPR